MFNLNLIPLLFVILATGSSQISLATPMHAIKEANNCGGCHNPGRAQRPLLWRRCSLDCMGCHVDPNGGGPRNQWGKYYSQDQLAMIKYFDPEDPFSDQSLYDLHYDGRLIYRESANSSRNFPMSSEFSLRLRPFVKYLHLTYQAAFLGRIGEDSFKVDRSDNRRFLEKFSLMVDGLPLNTYLRAARATPLYGIRRTNHTLWIRERTGLDQFSLSDMLIVGGTPNVPFFHIALHEGDHRQAEEDKQKGVSSHFGFRGVSYGWFVHGSLWETESEKNEIEMSAFGFGAKPLGFLMSAERNFRVVTEKQVSSLDALEFESRAQRVHPSSQIDDLVLAYTGIRGLVFGGNFETYKTTDQALNRENYFVEFHPIPNLQLEFWRRFQRGNSNKVIDSLAILHLYADF